MLLNMEKDLLHLGDLGLFTIRKAQSDRLKTVSIGNTIMTSHHSHSVFPVYSCNLAKEPDLLTCSIPNSFSRSTPLSPKTSPYFFPA